MFNKNEPLLVKLSFSLYSNFQSLIVLFSTCFPFFPIKIIKFEYFLKFFSIKSKIIGNGLKALAIMLPVAKFFH